MKRIGLWAIGMGLVVTVGFLTVKQGHADEKADAPRCTLKTMKGSYVFNATGYNIDEVSGPQPKAIVEVINADGDGKVTVPAVTLSLNGFIISPPNGGANGEYAVNDDCTGTLTFEGGPNFNIFVVPNGKEFHMIQTDEGTVFSGVSRRVTRKTRIGVD